MARVRIAKATSGAAFVSKKKVSLEFVDCATPAKESPKSSGSETNSSQLTPAEKSCEARLAAQESGELSADQTHDDIFELQHHHLLRCLECATVSRANTHRNTHCPMIHTN